MTISIVIRTEGAAPKGQESLAQGLPWVSSLDLGEGHFAMIMPRRWLQDSAQGFNPGNQPIKRFALKGREASE
jgi:hypothetical protein